MKSPHARWSRLFCHICLSALALLPACALPAPPPGVGSARLTLAYAHDGELWVAAPGQPPRQITQLGLGAGGQWSTPLWSPDAQRIAATVAAPGSLPLLVTANLADNTWRLWPRALTAPQRMVGWVTPDMLLIADAQHIPGLRALRVTDGATVALTRGPITAAAITPGNAWFAPRQQAPGPGALLWRWRAADNRVTLAAYLPGFAVATNGIACGSVALSGDAGTIRYDTRADFFGATCPRPNGPWLMQRTSGAAWRASGVETQATLQPLTFAQPGASPVRLSLPGALVGIAPNPSAITTPDDTVACPALPPASLAPVADLRVAIIGDSLSQGYGASNPANCGYGPQLAATLPDLLPDQAPIALRVAARGGMRIDQMAGAAQAMAAFAPDVAVVELGTNDEREGWPPAASRQALAALLATLQAGPATHRAHPLILCLGVWPSPDFDAPAQMAPYDALIAAACAQAGGIFIPIAPLAAPGDIGLPTMPENWHPNDLGALNLARLIAAVVARPHP